MNFIPTLKQITDKDQLNAYSDQYFKCSGLPIPEEYLTNPVNRVFAIYWKGNLIGGFILGRDTNFRTIQFFANVDKQERVVSQLGDLTDFTEICCFWIQRKCRTNTYLNIFVWLSMTYALRMYGTQQLLFGTMLSISSSSFMGRPQNLFKSIETEVNDKATFIFKAHRSTCVTGNVGNNQS